MGALETTISQLEKEISKAKARKDQDAVDRLENKLEAAKSYR